MVSLWYVASNQSTVVAQMVAASVVSIAVPAIAGAAAALGTLLWADPAGPIIDAPSKAAFCAAVKFLLAQYNSNCSMYVFTDSSNVTPENVGILKSMSSFCCCGSSSGSLNNSSNPSYTSSGASNNKSKL